MITGLSPDTMQRLQLGAGIFLTDFDDAAITDASSLAAAIRAAKASGTGILGATRGGGTFECKPKVRAIEADGKRFDCVGGTVFDGWEISMTGTLLETGAANMRALLAAADVSTQGRRTTVTLRAALEPGDHIGSLTWIGDTSAGFLLIRLKNALNVAGASFTFTDQGEGTLPFEFRAHQSAAGEEEAPVRITYFAA